MPIRWTAKRVVIGILVLVLTVNALLGWLHYLGIASESVYVAIMGFLLAGIGVSAGTVAARERKSGNDKAAITGYRIGVWCLALAFLQALSYGNARAQEEFFRWYNKRQEQIEKQIESEELPEVPEK